MRVLSMLLQLSASIADSCHSKPSERDSVAVTGHSVYTTYSDIKHSMSSLLAAFSTLLIINTDSHVIFFLAIGLDFVWSMYLHNPDRKIARHTKDQLLQLYHGYLAAQDSAPYHKALVK